MKKIAMFFAAVAVAASACAQKTAITSNKAGDNIYVGINLGAATPISNSNFGGMEPTFSTFTPQLGIRVGKNFTTVFGLAVDATADMNVKSNCTTDHKTFVDNLNLDLLGTANLMNLFGGYKGEPRAFEITALGGFGWTHVFGNDVYNGVNSKVALDFGYNFGSAKQFQVYLEPSLTWALEGFDFDVAEVGNGGYKYNVNKSMFALHAGFNYKFGCSNGKHNFAVEQLRDQAEIDGLNAKINDLRNTIAANEDACNKKLADKDAQIAKLKSALAECENKPVQVVKNTTANLQPTVVFSQGKSNVEKSQMANISLIAKYMKNHPDAKVKISGYASPEGNAELNQKLSEARAAAVKDVLVKNYKISADRLQTEGFGASDKVFEENEFNRVAIFNDVTK